MSDYLASLERMANQIARYFSAYPVEEATAGIADHLQRFWDPSMRRDLADAIAAGHVKVEDAVRDAIGRAVTDDPDDACGAKPT